MRYGICKECKKDGLLTPEICVICVTKKPLPVRPTPSPVIQINDGFGDTPFKRKLLYCLSLTCLVLFFLVFGFLMFIKIKASL